MSDEAEGGQSHIEHGSTPGHSSVNAASMVALKAELARAQNGYSKVVIFVLLHMPCSQPLGTCAFNGLLLCKANTTGKAAET